MKKLMIDLETMGLSDNAAIVSIGAVVFNDDIVTNTFYQAIDLQSNEDIGLSIDASTVCFWLSQPKEAQLELLSGTEHITKALQAFQSWYELIEEFDEVWTNGNKDFIWLKNAYSKALNRDVPFPYYIERDFRTARALLPIVAIPDEAIAHHAMYDARWQANYLIKALKPSKTKEYR